MRIVSAFFGHDLTADGGYIIGGNNDNNTDDWAVTKFAPPYQQMLEYGIGGSYTTFGFTEIPQTYTVGTSETWATSMNIASKIVIPSGHTLELTSGTYSFAASDQLYDYFMAPDNYSTGGGTLGCGILIQPGGKLIIDAGVTLKGINNAGEHNVWDGIAVQGTPSATATPADQGIIVINGLPSSPVLIQDARVGIYVADNYRSYLPTPAPSVSSTNANTYSSSYGGTYNLGGGIVIANFTNFLDCYYGINFQNMIFTTSNLIEACNFNTDATGMGDICYYTDPQGNIIPSNVHVAEWQESNVVFHTNTFTCDPSFAVASRPIGIGVVASGAQVGSLTWPANSFSNLSVGIETDEGPCVTFFNSIINNTFDNNTIGLNALGKKSDLLVTNNQFNVPSLSLTGGPVPMGINLFVCRKYDVSYNTFDHSYASGRYGWIGITTNDGCEENETINNNTFNHVSVANEALQWNGDGLAQGLQYRCNIFNSSILPIYVGSSRLGTSATYAGVIRPNQGSCGFGSHTLPPVPAGNQFYLSCATSYGNLYADGLVSEGITYNNNYAGSYYDPAPCISTVFTDVSCNGPGSLTPMPLTSEACPNGYTYSRPGVATAYTDLATLDETMSETTDAGTLADMQAQHDAITGFLARYYDMNGNYDSAAALYASYNMYRDALPFYISAADFTDAQTMYDNLPTVTDEDKQFKWDALQAITLFSAGNTWFDIDSLTLDSMRRTVQYNSAGGGMAGAVAELLGVGPVTYPVPAIDSNMTDTLAQYDSTVAEGARMAANSNSTTAVKNITNSVASFAIYPNPTEGTLTMNVSGAGKFTLYTILGQQVQEYAIPLGKTDIQLPAGLAAGVYMGTFTPTDGSASKQVRIVYEP